MFFPEGQIRVRALRYAEVLRWVAGAGAPRAGARDPLDGSLYVFVSRRATQIRLVGREPYRTTDTRISVRS
jgi:hypothetical protein